MSGAPQSAVRQLGGEEEEEDASSFTATGATGACWLYPVVWTDNPARPPAPEERQSAKDPRGVE